MTHIKTVKGIHAYICCIAAYNSALPTQNGTYTVSVENCHSVSRYQLCRLQYAQIPCTFSKVVEMRV